MTNGGKSENVLPANLPKRVSRGLSGHATGYGWQSRQALVTSREKCNMRLDAIL